MSCSKLYKQLELEEELEMPGSGESRDSGVASGGRSSSGEVKRSMPPIILADSAVHVIPIENLDGTLTYLFVSLEDGEPKLECSERVQDFDKDQEEPKNPDCKEISGIFANRKTSKEGIVRLIQKNKQNPQQKRSYSEDSEQTDIKNLELYEELENLNFGPEEEVAENNNFSEVSEIINEIQNQGEDKWLDDLLNNYNASIN